MSDGLYDWLLFLHIVAAMVWAGGAVVLGVLAIRVVHDGEPGAVARFIGNMRMVGPVVLAPATVAVVGFGVWLVLDSAAWGFGQFWVQLALALFAAALVIGAAHQSRAAIGAQRAADRGDDEQARRQLARWSWGYWAIVLLLIVATWDMVTKPGL
jgi:uncharacterized membrane protein